MTKLSVLFILTLGLAAFTALAAPFSSPQNVVVLRAGTASTGSQGFLDAYTPAGAPVPTIPHPNPQKCRGPARSNTQPSQPRFPYRIHARGRARPDAPAPSHPRPPSRHW